jgi:hypothetical protein
MTINRSQALIIKQCTLLFLYHIVVTINLERTKYLPLMTKTYNCVIFTFYNNVQKSNYIIKAIILNIF